MFLAFYRMRMFTGEDNDGGLHSEKVLNIVKKQGVGAPINLAKETLSEDMEVISFAVATDMAWCTGISPMRSNY